MEDVSRHFGAQFSFEDAPGADADRSIADTERTRVWELSLKIPAMMRAETVKKSSEGAEELVYKLETVEAATDGWSELQDEVEDSPEGPETDKEGWKLVPRDDWLKLEAGVKYSVSRFTSSRRFTNGVSKDKHGNCKMADADQFIDTTVSFMEVATVDGVREFELLPYAGDAQGDTIYTFAAEKEYGPFTYLMSHMEIYHREKDGSQDPAELNKLILRRNLETGKWRVDENAMRARLSESGQEGRI